MKTRAVIITAFCAHPLATLFQFTGAEYVVCADGGYRIAQSAGVVPDLLIGDFDSQKEPVSVPFPVLRVPAEKDDTDTMLCIKHVLNEGYRDILLLGGIGGRLDHTVANLTALAYLEKAGAKAILTDGFNTASLLGEGCHHIPQKAGFKFSLFAWGGDCVLSEREVKYPLSRATLTCENPLGVSNEFLGPEAVIEVHKGRLLLVLSKDEC